MATEIVITHGHATMPLAVVVEYSSTSGRYALKVQIGGVDAFIETPKTQAMAKYRAEFLYNLWADRLIPVYDAGFKAGRGV